VIEELIGEQFKGKDKLIAPNVRRCISAATLRLSISNARSACGCSAPTPSATGSSSRATTRRRSAASTAARPSAPGIRSRPRHRRGRGVSRSIARSSASTRTGENRFAIVQAEDELASIGMVIGAGWNGARAFTATSGPGISLMQEFIGLAYFAEIPVGDRRRPARRAFDRHADAHAAIRLLACAYASHGDTKHVLLFPRTRASASNSRPPRSISPTGCRRRSS
jgi:2-oxoglutarate/2-oxoacid ferredoxin oxidoreductase subunit alpha